MAAGRHRITALFFGVVFIYWIFTGCAYHRLPHQPTIEETPLPVAIKSKAAASDQKAPAGPEPEADAAVPEIYALEIPSQIPSGSGLYSHKVRWPNETLYIIAKWYTGTARNWKAIAAANPKLDPKKIGIGDTIAIPENLLVTRTPLPFSFGRTLVRKKVKAPALSGKKSLPAEPTKLFGPIESDKAESFAPTDSKASLKKSESVKLFGPVE
jgi:hypothetical protein